MSLPQAFVHQINVNPDGGVPKHRVAQTFVLPEGVSGDKQRDLRYHGGPLRAVCLFSLERIEALEAEGHPIKPGSVGENLTVRGLDWASLKLGDRLRVGSALLELTSHAAPCKQLSACFIEAEFTRISEKTNPGWSRLYAKVLEPGPVAEGDAVEHLPVKVLTSEQG